MRIEFEQIKQRGEKYFKCSCGRKVKRSKIFMQTINPFNTIHGVAKTRYDINLELEETIKKWKLKKEICSHPTRAEGRQ